MNKKNKNIIVITLISIILIVFIVLLFILNDKGANLSYVTLRTNFYDIYAWKYKIEDKNVIEFSEKKQSGDVDGKTDSGLIIEKYYFKALKEGKTNIEFRFTNTENGSSLDIKKYVATVDRDLKLKIEEQK